MSSKNLLQEDFSDSDDDQEYVPSECSENTLEDESTDAEETEDVGAYSLESSSKAKSLLDEWKNEFIEKLSSNSRDSGLNISGTGDCAGNAVHSESSPNGTDKEKAKETNFSSEPESLNAKGNIVEKCERQDNSKCINQKRHLSSEKDAGSLEINCLPGGVDEVLGILGKKKKMNSLDASRMLWNTFKEENSLEEDLSQHNKGRDNYLDKQEFLYRSDLKQFEIEKKLRQMPRPS
ncbi:Craniofacial development protein 1 [Trichinella murrelli]|uniref:Craniofacial development protein 1 n=1 Tax=Trichinella murrelli TaxID=144512 RepID=A0A0V0UF85_9BILA|nr:Craniofacial development protein 1 [Trichinella murrelli]